MVADPHTIRGRAVLHDIEKVNVFAAARGENAQRLGSRGTEERTLRTLRCARVTADQSQAGARDCEIRQPFRKGIRSSPTSKSWCLSSSPTGLGGARPAKV